VKVSVITSKAKQSIIPQAKLDCFVASLLAMTEKDMRSHSHGAIFA
jgi:hypothetical protein